MLSLSEVRKAAGSNPALEESLESLRQGVIELWERRTGHKWQKATDYVQTLAVNIYDCKSVWLSNKPVTAISKVEQLVDGAWEELDSDSYLLVDESRLDRIDGLSFEGFVRVTYDGGYDEDDCPDDIKLALLTQIKFIIARMGGDKVILRSEAFEGGSSSFETADIHPHFKNQAQHYRRLV